MAQQAMMDLVHPLVPIVIFKLYALDTKLDLTATASAQGVEKAMENHSRA